MKYLFFVLFFFGLTLGFSQTQAIDIVANINTESNTINIIQKITFHNYSTITIKEIYLHNWMNSYKNKDTPLSNRLIENYDKSLYFANEKNKGYTTINSITNPSKSTKYNFSEINNDIIRIELNKNLQPNDSIIIQANYKVKLPNAKFTKYGFSKNNFNLKYWYLSPVVYQKKWKTMSNYNMDDLYSYPTNYTIEFTIPKEYFLATDLNLSKKSATQKTKTYFLTGNNHSDVEINISKKNNFNYYKTHSTEVITNLDNKKLDTQIKTNISERQIEFIEDFLGKYPHEKILVNKIVYDKNPVYGLNQLPKILNPFKNIFIYDIQLFKALTNKFINNSLLINRRENYWLNDGVQTYLMLKYVEKYYPEIKAMGAISNIWGIRTYQLAKLNFNDKYAFVHQFAMRKNLDQPLNTRSDSLSTFNRKIVNKYKSGLGLEYLSDYLDKNTVETAIKQYYSENLLLTKNKKSFKKILSAKTNKDLGWFFGDYIKTNKKIDYTIKKVKSVNDSLIIEIKNKSDFNAPISIYGIKNKEIKYKKWVTNISDFKKITILKGDFDKISLNYESKYPEINLNNNWKKIKPSLFNRPLQVRFMKDIDNPYYNQLFYNVEYDFNYYDGIILGLRLGNQTLIKKKWTYNIRPSYGFKSNQINGSFNAIHSLYPKYNSIYKLSSGVTYSSHNYAPELKYQRISPFISINFKRKSLRDVGGKYLTARYLIINKEIAKDSISLESDNYNVLNIRYGIYKPEIIKNLHYNFDFQLAKKFSKLAFEIQYRKLRKNNTQIDLRIFAGSFIHNKTTSNFFDFSLNRPSDYLFDYSYFGRSEDTGFLSQQIIIAEGGFKSIFEKNTADQWMLSSNNSIGIWRWIEFYGDVGVYKNKGFNPQFKYDSGIRLNFVQNFFEIYFPIQSSNGFEIEQGKYPEKIRFVLTLSIGKIYNFVKRGFY
ncbi:MAG TPA: aminopeptidase [Crocinitomix sp.]|nr:aminopeptidase [Crocinitomix sp.]